MSEQNSCQLMSLQSRMLLMVARENMPKTISALLQEGAEIEAKGPDGYTPFLISAWFGHLENLKMLAENSADTKVTTPSGATALLLTAQRGFLHLVDYLLKIDVDPTTEDKDGDSPLSVAKKMNHQDIVELLTRYQNLIS